MSGERLALWWVERYTRGLDAPVRDERRAELASDLWEHRAAEGTTWATQLAIAGRCLRGAPADLSWRRSRARRRRALPGRAQVVRWFGWAVAGAAYGILVAQHAWFATALVGLDLYGADWAPGDVELWSRIGTALLLALVGGALLLRAAPRMGAGLVAAGSLGTAAAMWWALPLFGPLALAATSGAVVLARRRRRRLAFRPGRIAAG